MGKNRDTLLEYVIPIEVVEPVGEADLNYVKQVLVVVKPLNDQTELNKITPCNTNGEVTALTAAPVGAMLDYMPEVYILPQKSIDLTSAENIDAFKFFTVLIDKAFTTAEIEAANFGDFKDVKGICTSDRDLATVWARVKNQVAFMDLEENTGRNFYMAFGNLLGNRDWENQQFIEMDEPAYTNDVNVANVLFNARISFALSSEQFGNRLAFFAVGGKAIIAPYILEIVNVKMQARSLNWIYLNKPQYTLREAKLMEDDIQTMLDEDFVETYLIPYATVLCSLGLAGTTKNFVVYLDGDIAEPTALWRVYAKLTQGGNTL